MYHAEYDVAIYEIPRFRRTPAEQSLSSTWNHPRFLGADKLELVQGVRGLHQLVRINTMSPILSALPNKAS
jgi:hypothetical protein